MEQKSQILRMQQVQSHNYAVFEVISLVREGQLVMDHWQATFFTRQLFTITYSVNETFLSDS